MENLHVLLFMHRFMLPTFFVGGRWRPERVRKPARKHPFRARGAGANESANQFKRI
jgi:hypothetical protein